MATLKKKRILWVDDLIEQYELHAEEIRQNGYDVVLCSSVSDAKELFEEQHFDAAILDIKMPKSSGDRLAREFSKIQPHCNFALLSSYLNDEAVRNRLKRIEQSIYLIGKPIGSPKSARFEESVLGPLIYLLSSELKQSPKEYLNQIESTVKKHPFRIPFAEFDRLPAFAKLRLEKKAAKSAGSLLLKTFAMGNAWAILAGQRATLIKAGTAADRVPSRDEVRKIGKAEKSAYYLIFNGPRIENLTVLDVLASKPQAEPIYPALTFQFQNMDIPIKVHYDTGAQVSLFSFEFADQIRAIGTDVTEFTVFRAGGGAWTVAALEPQDVTLFDSGGKASFNVQLQGIAVRDWKKSGLFIKCPDTCRYFSGNGKTCVQRNALIGRDFLCYGENKRLDIVISGDGNATGIKQRVS